MINYIWSLNRALKLFDYNVDIFSNPIFKDKTDGQIPVLGIYFAYQKANSAVVKCHIIVHREDRTKILDHTICDPYHSVGYVHLYIVPFGIALGLRRTAMW